MKTCSFTLSELFSWNLALWPGYNHWGPGYNHWGPGYNHLPKVVGELMVKD